MYEKESNWIKFKNVEDLMKIWSGLKPQQEVFIHKLYFDTSLSRNMALHYRITAAKLGECITASVDHTVTLPACLGHEFHFVMFDFHYGGDYYLEIIPWAYLNYEKQVKKDQQQKFKMLERSSGLGKSELQFLRKMMNI